MNLSLFQHPEGWYLETETRIHAPRDEVFPFFSDCRNLELLTPPDLRFRILSDSVEMKPGAIIDYELRLSGIPFQWQTEISEWKPPYRFVDTQLVGPYHRWVHEHAFLEDEDGTIMTDRVNFRAPGGRLVHELFVNGRVREIFLYRASRFSELFPKGSRTESLV